MRAFLLVPLSLLWLACAPVRPTALDLQREGHQALHVGPVTLTVHLKRGGQPLTTADVQVQADMTHAGMATVSGKTVSLGGGLYRVSGLDLSMAGDWVLSVTAKPGGTAITGTLPLSVQP
ncbi:FixH family protein (plasmid) [Deinococcus radiomollis]|uniref:FixH family protein n=1 Tax=Deinococcus radiomollis TaxID=468916 RepID=UPI0038914E7E